LIDYTQRPLNVYWELTRACELACRHCRAEAVLHRDPNELTTEEGYRLLDQLLEFGAPLPHIVITGGDPLKRPDVWELIAAARERGFPTAITPSGTYALSEEIVARLKDQGIWMMGLSIDGSDAERHDGVRMVPGSFEQTVRAAGWARDAGIPYQVNTLVCTQTVDDLPAVYDLLVKLGAARWSLFFLIQVGRGRGLEEVSPDRAEEVLQWLVKRAAERRMPVTTTEAPHYRRVMAEAAGGVAHLPEGARRGFGIRDGSGIMFISHLGEVQPAGFLPLVAGNVRERSPVDIYRSSTVFTQVRDMSRLKGKCGLCEYKNLCGGSRARAYAYSGDPLESDPLCRYEPQHASNRTV
jgi:radical SAM protein with 4Fe4S-binding SPASM domain